MASSGPRRGRAVATVACAVGLVVAVPGQVSGVTRPPDPFDGSYDTVRFQPLRGSLPVSSLRSGAVRKHRLVVVPFTTAGAPTRAKTEALIAGASSFWQAQVPGLRIVSRVLPARTVPSAAVCRSSRLWALAARAARMTSPRVGQHLVAWSLDCEDTGTADLADGGGRIFVGGRDPQVLAHEFGHNLGLRHANRLRCTSDGRTVPLSGSCREYEYGDVTDLMGGGVRGLDLLPEKGLGGVWTALLGGAVRQVRGGRSSEVALATSGRGLRSALLRTPFGTVAFSAAVPAATLGIDAGVTAGLWTRAGSAALTVPEPDGSLEGADARLGLGDSWDVAGTRMRAVVLAAGGTASRLRFVPTAAVGPPPPPPQPVAPDPGQVGVGFPWTLSWAPSPDTGVVAYHVDVDGRVVARVPGDTRTAEVPALEGPAEVRVWAVGRDGTRADSAPMTVAPVSASVGVTLGLSPSPDGLLVATGPFPVSWQAVPATAGQRAVSWELTLTPDSAGTAFVPGEIVTLPAATRSYLVDPQALGWTPYSSWRISVAGVDSAGERFIVSDSEFVSYEP